MLRAVPIALAALAVAVPARAGLVNVGGEGQLIIGAVAATGVGVSIGGQRRPAPLSWLLMALAGAAAGAVWAGIAGVLRTTLGANEAVTTLLHELHRQRHHAVPDLPAVEGPERRRAAAEPARSPTHAQLPKLFGSQLNLGVLIALAVVRARSGSLLRRTGLGLRAAGRRRQPEAGPARRPAGQRLLVSSMVVGGALAGLGGMLNFAGVEFQLRPDITAHLRLHRLPRQLPRPAQARSRWWSPRVLFSAIALERQRAAAHRTASTAASSTSCWR